MDPDYYIITAHLLGALAAGGIIGLERSYHGRPAGFRTHTLVCLASSLLMLIMLYQHKWLPGATPDTIRTDPTRMAQGIMTGIGFLGAGVIFKEGLSVRGLTTAASIWMTAAIGILMGIGFYFPAVLATVLTIGILSVFRRIESRMPSHSYVHHQIRFRRHEAMTVDELRQMLGRFGFSVANISYRIPDDEDSIEYRMVLRTDDPGNTASLAAFLLERKEVRTFQLSPTGD
ncbi:putative Mg2+ transporter-C (MgtC) family protein [Noviherbaspirillum humi]|uniref:Protein MgtC n=1 Tax=Noviherbaspirillum humi TaxID=1688639 RepID=A0A239FF36_9BURK|nr:MgtC/SapB family protein [Noviherbaspirillum humi]SNS55417.1 putative Mg2+ transporter-C (MgtC) family protein [Noviherbaspirillum humi]